MNCLFIKNNRVKLILVFDDENVSLAESIKNNGPYDSFIFTNQSVAKHSEVVDGQFIAPTEEYLFSIGLIDSISEKETTDGETL